MAHFEAEEPECAVMARVADYDHRPQRTSTLNGGPHEFDIDKTN